MQRKQVPERLTIPIYWHTSSDYRIRLPNFVIPSKPGESNTDALKKQATDFEKQTSYSVEQPDLDHAVGVTLGKGPDTSFKVMLNVPHFFPEQIVIKTIDNFVVVHGKHDEHGDHHGYIAREFTRRYRLPNNVDPKDVTATYSYPERILVLMVPLKKPDPPPKDDSDVPLKVQKGVNLKRPHDQSAV